MKKFSPKALVLLAVLIAFLFRFYSIEKPNFYYDESAYAFITKKFVYENVSSFDIATVVPPLNIWINSIPARFLGVNEFSMRLSSLIFGTSTVLIAYLLAKLWYDSKHGVLSAFLLSVFPLHVIYSRTAFYESIQTFFILTSILILEYFFKKRLKYLLLLSGILFGLAFLTRYNALVIWGLYWIFRLGYALLKKRHFIKYLSYTIISTLTGFLLVVTAIFFTGGIEDLIYVANGIIFWIAFQYQQQINPFYYYPLALIDSIGILFLLFPLAIICLILYKKKKLPDYFLVFIILSYLLLLLPQTRRFARYYMMMVPFIAILFSRLMIIISKNYKKYTLLFTLIVFSSALWSFYEIQKDINFNVWHEARGYVNKYYPNAHVHGSNHKSRQIQYYLDENADNSERISTLKRNDLVVFTWLYPNSTILENSPLEDNLIFIHKRKRKEYSDEFIDYVMKYGRLVKTFEYKKATALWIYEMKSIRFKEDKPKEEFITLTWLWDFVCKHKSIRKIIERILSQEQVEAVNLKCMNLLEGR